jgi:5'-nucleotidase / UDP-sugar diphosphatase
MKVRHREPAAAAVKTKAIDRYQEKRPSRREVLAGAAAIGTTILTGALPAAAEENAMKKTFTILHTNDMHSAFIGMGPASDYTPFTLNDDNTRGGYARLAGLIAQRQAARKDEGPVLVLDAGDYSMGTPFGAASGETGGELQLMFLMGYDATTLAITTSTSDLTAWPSQSA